MAEPRLSSLLRREQASERECDIETVSLCEIKALIRFATERGIDQDGVVLGPLNEAVRELQSRESKTTPAAQADASTARPDGAKGPDDIETRALILYVKLTALTLPVNGRSVLETERHFRREVWPLQAWALAFLVIALGNEVLEIWFSDLVAPDTGILVELMDIRRAVFDVCTPFLWGALGSCVYLLKRLNDMAEERLFDRAASRGWTTRIVLGAILGGAVQYIYDPKLFSEEGFKLGASAIGFLTGVGVKIVYGAIEKTVQVLAEKMNLETVKRDGTDTVPIRHYLAEQLSRVDKAKDPASFDALTALLANLPQSKK